MTDIETIPRQESVDQFYFATGQCCAGCDLWAYINSVLGECTISQLVSGTERLSGLDILSASGAIPAGHVFTQRNFVCGNFQDQFNWSSLPITYLKRIGYRELP